MIRARTPNAISVDVSLFNPRPSSIAMKGAKINDSRTETATIRIISIKA